MLKHAALTLLSLPGLLMGPIAIAQADQIRPTPEQVRDALQNLASGQSDPLFTPEFAARAKNLGSRLFKDIGSVVGAPTMARPIGPDTYMVYYSGGFVLWHLTLTPQGRISGASYEIRDNPGTKGITLSTRDQRGAAAFSESLNQLASAYQEQQRQDQLFTAQVLAKIHADGGYTSSGAGVGARGAIISDEQYTEIANAASTGNMSGNGGSNLGVQATSGPGILSDGDLAATETSGSGSFPVNDAASVNRSSPSAGNEGRPALQSDSYGASSDGNGIDGAIIVEQLPPIVEVPPAPVVLPTSQAAPEPAPRQPKKKRNPGCDGPYISCE